jgi:hypothetical protein
MLRYIHRVAVFLLILKSVSCFGQEPVSSGQNRKPLTAEEINSFFGVTTYPFTISIKLKSKTWDSRRPLVIDVVFKNTAERSVFIDLKSSFQFNGWLNDNPKKLPFRVVWRQEGQSFQSKKEDYTEIPAGEELKATLTSLRIEARPVVPNSEVPWRKHRPGKYTLFLNYSCGSRRALFPGEWSGQAVSEEVELIVK